MRLAVKKNHPVGDAVEALELVRDQNNGDAQAVSQAEHELVEAARRQRVESGRRLVQKENGRIERKSARSAARLRMPPQACRVAVFVAGEADERELESSELGRAVATG